MKQYDVTLRGTTPVPSVVLHILCFKCSVKCTARCTAICAARCTTICAARCTAICGAICTYGNENDKVKNSACMEWRTRTSGCQMCTGLIQHELLALTE